MATHDLTDDTTATDRLQDARTFLQRYYKDQIGELAQNYPSEQKSIGVEWDDLYAYSGPGGLAEQYRQCPAEIGKVLNEALRTITLPVDVDLDEARVRVTGLPDEYHIGEFSPADQFDDAMAVTGQVQKVSAEKPVPIKLGFECQRCGCTTVIPQDGDGVDEPHECSGCERDGPYRVLRKKEYFRNWQTVRLQPPPEKADSLQGTTIDVHLRDDLTGSVEAGDRVSVDGVLQLEEPDGDQQGWTPYLDGEAVTAEQTDYSDINVAEHRERIEALAAGEEGDPIKLLVDSLAPKLVGIDEIKEAVILQLFGGNRIQHPDGSVDRGDSHILLLGDPGVGKSKLLDAVDTLAPRSVKASGDESTKAGLTAACVQDDFGDSQWSLEAGAMVAGDEGIACIDEIDKTSEDVRSSLHDALESQEVTINKGPFTNVRLSARTALLAAGNPQHGRFDPYEPIGDQITLGPTLLSRFDLWFMLHDDPSEDEPIVESIVEGRTEAARAQATGEDAPDALEPAVEPEVIRSWIALAKRSCTPHIRDQEVRDKLEHWFTELRTVNGDDPDAPVPVTRRSLEGVFRLAEASARVRLSETITEADVNRAIRLVERSLRDVGFDRENAQFDIDAIETGEPLSQKQRRKQLRTIVLELMEEGDYMAEIETVKEVAADTHGIAEEKVEHDIAHWKKHGQAVNPQSGYVRYYD
jgi:replicative DNA helicase Mcm